MDDRQQPRLHAREDEEPEPRARCTAHGDRPTVECCERCGAFACLECLSATGSRRCAACVRRELAALPSLAQRATLARAGLMTMAILSVLSFPLGGPGSASAVELPMELLQPLQPLLQLGTIVAFLAWLHLAVRYAQAHGRRVTSSPRAAVLWWFVPVANFIVPFARIRELAPGLSTRTWQACWAATFVLSAVAVEAARPPGESMKVAYAFLVLGLAATVASAALGATAVRAVTASLTPRGELDLGLAP